jgi:L-rhamnose mutarotase
LLFSRDQGGKPVQRYAQVTRLTPEHEAEYVRYHQEVWPTVLGVIAECEITNYSIYLCNGFLFSYFEYHGADYEADMRKMAANPEMQRWWTIMNPTLAAMPGAEDGRLWSPMREVFHFEGREALPTAEAASKIDG